MGKDLTQKAVIEVLPHSKINVEPKDQCEAVYSHEPLDCIANTCITSKSCDLAKDSYTIKIEGAGVIRYGLTDKDPAKYSDFLLDPVFEKEDGFEPTTSYRKIRKIDSIGHIFCSSPDGWSRDFPPSRPPGTLYLYITIIYGKPHIQAYNDNGSIVQWNSKISGKNIEIKGDTVTLRCVMNTEVCRMKDPIEIDDVYHINWNMKLDQEQTDDRHPQLGFFRLSIMTQDVTDGYKTAAINSGYNGPDVCFIESAIAPHSYNGKIAFRIFPTASEIAHNLKLNSLGGPATLDLNLDRSKVWFLYMELSSGEISISHGKHLIVKQELGSLCAVQSKSDWTDRTEVKYTVSANIGREPRDVMFGRDPRSFLGTFNDKLTNVDFVKLRRLFGGTVREVQETNSIQVFTGNSDLKQHHIEEFFSRDRNCGGGEILMTKDYDDFPGIWTIRYENEAVAAEVCKQSSYDVKGYLLPVLPYYEAIGLSLNRGEPLLSDDTPIALTGVDEAKQLFVAKRQSEVTKFEQHMSRRHPVRVIWKEYETDDTFQGASIKLSRDTQSTNPRTQSVAVTKSMMLKLAQEYFETRVFQKRIETSKDDFRIAVNIAEKAARGGEYDIECKSDPKTNTILLTASQDGPIAQLVDKISAGCNTVTSARAKFELPVELIPNYQVLEDEGRLDDIERECPNTRFSIDYSKGISMQGPSDEVNRASTVIQDRMINIQEIRLLLSSGMARYLQNKDCGALLAERLGNEKISKQFKIQDCFFTVMVYLDNRNTEQKRKDTINKCIKAVVSEADVKIPEHAVKQMKKDDWKQIVDDIEAEEDNKVIITGSVENGVAQIIGLRASINRSKQRLLQLLNTRTEFFYLHPDIIDYSFIYGQEDFVDKCEFERDGTSDEFTGNVQVTGNPDGNNRVTKMQTKLDRDTETYTLHFSLPWLAKYINDSKLIRGYAVSQECLVYPDTADSLAMKEIPCIALHESSGAKLQLSRCGLHEKITEVVVLPADVELIPISKKIYSPLHIDNDMVKAALQKRTFRKTYQLGNADIVTFTESKRLLFRAVGFIFIPPWSEGSQEESAHLKKAFISVLEMAASQRYRSVTFSPASLQWHGSSYPIREVGQAISEAVVTFFQKKGNSSIKEIHICDKSRTALTTFTEVMSATIQQPAWFVFKHDRMAVPPVGAREGVSKTTRYATNALFKPDFSDSIRKIFWGQGDEVKMVKQVGASPNQGLNDENEDGLDSEAKKKTEELTIKVISDTKTLPLEIFLAERVKLYIVKGDIEKQKVNVVVNTTPTFPRLTGTVSAALLKAGGKAIQKECDRHEHLYKGEILVGCSGSLPCDHIYHVVQRMEWDSLIGVDHVKEIVLMCLKRADLSKCSSIAFPAIGTRDTNFPGDKVADAMLKGIIEFMKEIGKQPVVVKIYIVIPSDEDKTIKAFYDQGLRLTDVQPEEKTVSMRDIVLNKVQKKTEIPYQPGKDHSDADDVLILKIVGKTKLRKAREDFEKLLSKMFITKEISYKTILSGNRALTNEEEAIILKLEKTFFVALEVDHNKFTIKIRGKKSEVDNAEMKVNELLNLEFTVTREQEHLEELLKDTVQWWFDDGGTEKPVSTKDNFVIHMEYLKGFDFVYKNSLDGLDYHVDITTLHEYPVGKPNNKRALCQRTRQRSGIRIPLEWSISLDDTVSNAEVELDTKSAEFNEIKKKFIADGCKPKQILKIIRLEDRFKYLQYESKKDQMKRINPKGKENEKQLWHGTDVHTIGLIKQHGFDRNFTGKNATAYGEGCYFAVNSSYSNRYAVADANGVQRMFLCRVLTGISCLGKAGMTVLPERCTVGNVKVMYDSATDNVKPNMYVIFHDCQAYPAYIIEYKI